ncbi:hypothetical protein L7F22_061674 [Adiantum nelumboides]|nr:hypothetical protein [Adiantum nelumboides]
MQEGRVIAYESRMFSKLEMTVQIYEEELLAVIHALTQWRHYLRGADFTVFTDHQSLRYFLSQKQLLEKQMRVVADIHRFGHRHAFNVAFQNLGLDCANWSEPVYADLLRQAGGSEEQMLSLFFDRIGWPLALPTDQKGAFIQNLLREKQAALQDRVNADSLSLRPGVESFVDEVLDAGVPLVILAAYNKSGEIVARSLIQKLGTERVKKISFVGQKEVEESAYGQVVLGAGSSMGLDEELAAEAAKAVAAEKQWMAEEVASLLKLSVEVDTSFSKNARKAIALLRAGAEVAGVSARHCVLLAGGDAGVQAAERIGMPCVAVRSSFTSRAEFPAAMGTYDDHKLALLACKKGRNACVERVLSSSMLPTFWGVAMVLTCE